MSHCIDILNGELVAVDGAKQVAENIHGLLTVKTFTNDYKLMSDNRIYNIYNNELINFFTNETDINFDNINIILCNDYIVVFTHDGSYHCKRKNSKIYQIGETNKISCPVIDAHSSCFAYIDYSVDNKLYLVTHYFYDDYKSFVCDTGVAHCFVISFNFPNEHTLLYQKINKKVVYRKMAITDYNMVSHLQFENNSHIFFCKSKYVVQTRCYYNICPSYIFLFIDDDSQLYTIGIYKYNDIPCLITHHTWQNYLFKDFRLSSEFQINFVYLQTIDNVIIKFNVRTFEFMVVATNYTFCLERKTTKKSI